MNKAFSIVFWLLLLIVVILAAYQFGFLQMVIGVGIGSLVKFKTTPQTQYSKRITIGGPSEHTDYKPPGMVKVHFE